MASPLASLSAAVTVEPPDDAPEGGMHSDEQAESDDTTSEVARYIDQLGEPRDDSFRSETYSDWNSLVDANTPRENDSEDVDFWRWLTEMQGENNGLCMPNNIFQHDRKRDVLNISDSNPFQDDNHSDPPRMLDKRDFHDDKDSNGLSMVDRDLLSSPHHAVSLGSNSATTGSTGWTAGLAKRLGAFGNFKKAEQYFKGWFRQYTTKPLSQAPHFPESSEEIQSSATTISRPIADPKEIPVCRFPAGSHCIQEEHGVLFPLKQAQPYMPRTRGDDEMLQISPTSEGVVQSVSELSTTGIVSQYSHCPVGFDSPTGVEPADAVQQSIKSVKHNISGLPFISSELQNKQFRSEKPLAINLAPGASKPDSLSDCRRTPPFLAMEMESHKRVDTDAFFFASDVLREIEPALALNGDANVAVSAPAQQTEAAHTPLTARSNDGVSKIPRISPLAHTLESATAELCNINTMTSTWSSGRQSKIPLPIRLLQNHSKDRESIMDTVSPITKSKTFEMFDISTTDEDLTANSSGGPGMGKTQSISATSVTGENRPIVDNAADSGFGHLGTPSSGSYMVKSLVREGSSLGPTLRISPDAERIIMGENSDYTRSRSKTQAAQGLTHSLIKRGLGRSAENIIDSPTPRRVWGSRSVSSLKAQSSPPDLGCSIDVKVNKSRSTDHKSFPPLPDRRTVSETSSRKYPKLEVMKKPKRDSSAIDMENKGQLVSLTQVTTLGYQASTPRITGRFRRQDSPPPPAISKDPPKAVLLGKVNRAATKVPVGVPEMRSVHAPHDVPRNSLRQDGHDPPVQSKSKSNRVTGNNRDVRLPQPANSPPKIKQGDLLLPKKQARHSTNRDFPKSKVSASRGVLSNFRGLFAKQKNDVPKGAAKSRFRYNATANMAGNPALSNSPALASTGAISAVAMEILDSARQEQDISKKGQLLRLSKILVAAINNAHDAEKAMLRAFQAAKDAEIACSLAKTEAMKMSKAAREYSSPSQSHSSPP